MRRIAYLAGGSALAMAAAIGFGGVAAAQDEPTEVQEVVITGSLIAGTPEDAALPVDVIGAEELAKQGSPSTVELLKGLSVSNGVLGDTNQFDSRAQGSEGSGSVNLRGLGPTRTLVLLNGRRMPINPFALAGAGAVDTNIIPSAAIGRVEVLKDGAAATYGSDAIAGVVNFITRKNFEGGELSASYKHIDGSDGDWTASALWGWSGENSDAFVALGYQHRSELSVTERDFANRSYLENPEGGWTAAGSPSTFVPLAANTTGFRDSNCQALGGYAGFSGNTPVCYAHYIEYDNLVEREERFQVYGEFNHQFNDTTKLHIEGLFASTDVPEWKTSPSYALLATPTATTSPVPGRYYIPNTNPGLIRYAADNPTLGNYSLGTGACTTGALQNPCVGAPSAVLLAAGALNVANRPYLLGGNPMFGNGASRGTRNFEAYRLSAELSGQFTEDLNWQISATYGEERGNRTGYDTIVGRYQLALRGLGGANCNGIVAGQPGSTCEWFNPFSSAIPGAPDYDPSLANSVELTRWFFQKLETEQKTGMFVVEALLSGKMFTLGGGDAAWAIGGQYRRSTFDVWYNDISNRAINPCLDTPINGSKTCTSPQGPFAFLGVGSNAYVEQSTWAGFGEVQLPFTDNFNVSIAARYESIEDVGETFDPKISAKWQIFEPLALRASVGTTFRAPVPSQLTTDFVTSLQSINGTFRAVDIYGNPDLEPETATTYNIGVILEVGGFKASLDYFNFDFKDPITSEPVSGLVRSLFPQGIVPNATLNCASPFASRFSFSGGQTCAQIQAATPDASEASVASGAITRVTTNTINGAGVQTSGIDLLADYTFDDVMGGTLTIGGSATYVLEYVTDALEIGGVELTPSFDAVGLLNYQTTAYPLPQWKGSLFVEYTNGPHNGRITVRHIDGYTDQRPSPFAENTYWPEIVKGATSPAITAGKNIDSWTTVDFTYRVFLPWDSTLAISADNIFDEDPPFARLDLSYDPFTASGLGRTFKFSLSKKF